MFEESGSESDSDDVEEFTKEFMTQVKTKRFAQKMTIQREDREDTSDSSDEENIKSDNSKCSKHLSKNQNATQNLHKKEIGLVTKMRTDSLKPSVKTKSNNSSRIHEQYSDVSSAGDNSGGEQSDTSSDSESNHEHSDTSSDDKGIENEENSIMEHSDQDAQESDDEDEESIIGDLNQDSEDSDEEQMEESDDGEVSEDNEEEGNSDETDEDTEEEERDEALETDKPDKQPKSSSEENLNNFEKLRKELADLPFSDLQMLKEKIGVKAYNQAMFGTASGRKTKKTFKRENKNRPTEMSSKRSVGRFREVIQVKKKVFRDPRFDDKSGEYDDRVFRQTYSFISDVKQREKQKLVKRYQKEKDGDKKKQLEGLIVRLNQQEKSEREKVQKIAKQQEARKKTQELLKEGKQPYYLKKADQKKVDLAEKFKELSKSGKLDKYLTKKRKKMASKDRKHLPNKHYV